MTAALPDPVRILLVDDSELIRAGLAVLLGAEGGEPALQIVGEAASVAAAVKEAARLKPDIVLLDIRLPDGTGFDACRRFMPELPETRVVVLSAIMDDSYLYEAIRCGCQGYLLKEIDAASLRRAIIDVAGGKSILDPFVTARVVDLVRSAAVGGEQERSRLAQLSNQECRVLELVAVGKTNKEIGEHMGLSDKTVKNYLSNAFEKLQVSRRSQAAAIFVQRQGSATPWENKSP